MHVTYTPSPLLCRLISILLRLFVQRLVEWMMITEDFLDELESHRLHWRGQVMTLMLGVFDLKTKFK